MNLEFVRRSFIPYKNYEFTLVATKGAKEESDSVVISMTEMSKNNTSYRIKLINI